MSEQCCGRPTKNAIVIMLDTLQFNYLGCYGNSVVKTPNLDRLAREGVLFENAYSEGVPTVPVRRALLTGRFTLPFGGWQPLTSDDTTVADILWGKNIQTALIYDTPPMRLPKYGYARGFDFVSFHPGQELDHTRYANVSLDPAFKPENYTSAGMLYDDKGDIRDADSTQLLEEIECFLKQQQHRRSDADSYVAKVMTDAEDWIVNRRDKTSPFFLWIDSFDPHEPWDPQSMWEGKPCPYDPDYEGKPLLLAPWTPVEGRITDRECEHIRALYMEVITCVDKWVGSLLDTVRKEGLWDSTMVTVISDHGNPMGKGEHGHGIMRKCRPWPYEELVHIPVLMHIPGIKGGQRIKGFIQNVDVTATVMDALGELNAPTQGSDYGFPTYNTNEMQGLSMLPMLRGEAPHPREHAVAGYYGMSWSLITDEWSYIHWLVDASVKDSVDCIAGSGTEMKEEMWSCTAGAKVEVPGHDELYNRRTDPFQLNNLILDKPDVAEAMLQKLKVAISEIRAS